MTQTKEKPLEKALKIILVVLVLVFASSILLSPQKFSSRSEGPIFQKLVTGFAGEGGDEGDNPCHDGSDMCTPSSNQGCGTNIGECTTGIQTCSSQCDWGGCSGIGPTSEICDGLDNDCNGLIDDGIACGCTEGENRVCGINSGACQTGTQTCSGGTWSICGGGYMGPTQETCNNIDDDCDGTADELLIQSCESDIGECSSGTQTCSFGSWGSCSGNIGPTQETCDNKDNDCDNLIDEFLTQTCGTNDGECQTGTQTCFYGSWGGCGGTYVGPTQEICGDGIDQDCNEGDLTCDCQNGATQSCLTGQNGICSGGQRTCLSNSWGLCLPNNIPGIEICDELDNDCDGSVDEGNVCDPAECRDSDGGLNYPVQGTVIGATENTLIDYCDSEFNDRLIEYICTQNEYGNYYSLHTCPELCQDGACVAAPPEEENDTLITPSCVDSDPINNLLVAGFVEGIDVYGNHHTFKDECLQTDETQVLQYSCFSDPVTERLSIQQRVYDCPTNYLCEEGTCSSLSQCTDAQGNVIINIEKACYNPTTNQLEMAFYKDTPDEIVAMDFTVNGQTGSKAYTCGQTCGECSIQATGSKEYSISIWENQKPTSIILETINCNTGTIDIELC